MTHDPRLSGTQVGMAKRTRRIHFVGIGGIGMSGIAEVLFNLGYEVRGSDQCDSEVTERLAGLGCDVRIGHDSGHVDGVDVVVVSSAVRATNAEVEEARRRKVPVIRRAEMLAELMRLKLGIAVAGTHGKTTVTSLIGAVLTHAELDPTIVVGGKLNKLKTSGKLGLGPYLVAEADESDGSFLHLSPTIAVVTNIDPEHLDHYRGGMGEIRQTFRRFVNRIPFYGLAVLCIDHPEVQALLASVERRTVTYGLSPQADLHATGLLFDGPRTSFDLVARRVNRGRFTIPMLGQHSVQNALAALAVAEELGVSWRAAGEALAAFDGIERRFSVRGEVRDVIVVDDYGHHPAEIRATLDGARRAYPDRRIIAAFQPHRYTRTHSLMGEFATAFNQSERVWVVPVYGAGEPPIAGVTHEVLAEAIRAHGHRDVRTVSGVAELVDALAATVSAGELVVCFGAGDIGQAGMHLVRAIGGERKVSK